MRQTRVLHLIESDGLYGAEQVVLALSRQAASDPQFPATIGCLVKDPAVPHALHDYARQAGLDAVMLPVGYASAPFDVWRLTRTLRRLNVGLIHTHGYKPAIAGYAARVLNRAAIVGTCHLWFDDSDLKWTYRALTALEIRLYPRFDHMVAVSGPIADRLRRAGVPADRVSQVNNGISTAVPSCSADDIASVRARCRAAADSILVVNVGRLADQKAQADLIDAARRVRGAGVDVRVAILGEGHLRAALEAQIASCGLHDAVTLPGFTGDVRPYLAAADIFALPSVDEGLPIALLEAAMAGLPIVCTPVGAIPTLLRDGDSALFVPVHDPAALSAAIMRLAADRQARRDIGRRGRDAAVRAHSVEAMYAAYRAVYERVIEGRDDVHDRRR